MKRQSKIPDKPLLPAARIRLEDELADQEALERRSIFDEALDDVSAQIGFASRTYGPRGGCRSSHFTVNTKFTRYAKKKKDTD